MRALNGSLTELRPLWHFNRKRGKEELWRVGEGTSCQGVIVQSFCVPALPPCPLGPILRAVGLDSHHHPSPNLSNRQGIHRTEYGHGLFRAMLSGGEAGTGEPSSEPPDLRP